MGKIESFTLDISPLSSSPRKIWVYLPNGYDKSNKKYDVLYMFDGHNLFFDETVFDELYNEAIIGDFDIVEFKALRHYNFHINIHHLEYTIYSNNNHNVAIFQPELSIYPRKRGDNYGVYDCFLWGKIIKAEKYKKTI